MSTPRPIRPIDGNALLEAIEAYRRNLSGANNRGIVGNVMDRIRNAPTLPQPEPVAVSDGDAISRSAVLETFKRVSLDPMTRIAVEETIKQFPSLPRAQPEAGAGHPN